jgi:hypothetical protein
MPLSGILALRASFCNSKLLKLYADGEALPPESFEDGLAEVSSAYGDLAEFTETLALILWKEGRLLWLSV